jgi:hypothetical protein
MGKHRWKQIVHDVLGWRHITYEHRRDLLLSCSDMPEGSLERASYFPSTILQPFYVSIAGTWIIGGHQFGFQEGCYTDDPPEAFDSLYRCMFAEYLGLPASTRPGALLNAVEQYVRKRHADKARKNKERRRRDRMRREGLKREAQPEPPVIDLTTPPDAEETVPPEIQAAFDAQELPEPTELELLAKATFELTSSRSLTIFADCPQGKATAYILQDGPKSLIKWEWHFMLQSLVARTTDGKVLWARCQLPTCEKAIYFFDEAHRYTKHRHAQFWGEEELLCDVCFFKLRNALFFGKVLPLGYTSGLLSLLL